MTYFSKFPLTSYELNLKATIVTDILRRTAFISEYKPYTDLYTSYTIRDGESAQTIGKRIYGSSFYHWVVLIFNEIHDPTFDWPLDQLSLELMAIDKYGPAVYMTRHFEKDGHVIGEVKEFVAGTTWISPTNPGPLDLSIIPISFYDHEQKLNDEKRNIKLMRPELLSEFVKQHESAINV
jgi:Base plate wedge protein 53